MNFIEEAATGGTLKIPIDGQDLEKALLTLPARKESNLRPIAAAPLLTGSGSFDSMVVIEDLR